MLDSSGSLGTEGYRLEKAFLNDFTNLFTVGATRTRVSTVLFSRDSSIAFDLDDHLTNTGVVNAISALPYLSSFTNIVQALRDSATLFSQFAPRPGIPRVAVLLTDGKNNRGTEAELFAAADALRASGIYVFAVGVTADASIPDLNRIVGGDTSRVFAVDDFTDLTKVVDQLAETICRKIKEQGATP